MTATASNNSGIRALVAGNWKMNGLKSQLGEALAVDEALGEDGGAVNADVMICPPATMVMVMAELSGKGGLKVGAQDCHTAASGAHTGDVASEMLADAGASAIIVGHSERRADHGETDRIVREKAEAAHRAGLVAIVCVGETIGQRKANMTLDVIARQLAGSLPDGATAENCVVAYEPVWAIGTGLTPEVSDVAEVHAMIREKLTERFAGAGESMRILYGGSVKPSNAQELMSVANVNGALVGGASLKAKDFLGIVEVYRAQSSA
ncbi:MAG: triose-phosphate isomerase [Alphaproteobacteria bacterium]|nr:triose-phosphate isomerase [Alphaproteobacteria bacterium]